MRISTNDFNHQREVKQQGKKYDKISQIISLVVNQNRLPKGIINDNEQWILRFESKSLNHWLSRENIVSSPVGNPVANPMKHL